MGTISKEQTELTKKVQELFQQIDYAKIVDKLCKSGAVTQEEIKEQNWRLAKNMACAICSHIEWQYQPNSKSDKKQIKNLKHFI